jgi:hypothetical protein
MFLVSVASQASETLTSTYGLVLRPYFQASDLINEAFSSRIYGNLYFFVRLLLLDDDDVVDSSRFFLQLKGLGPLAFCL